MFSFFKKKRKEYKANISLVEVKPYKHAKGLGVAEDFVKSFGVGVHSFEIWSSERDKTRIVFGSSEPEVVLRKKISAYYPLSSIEPVENVFPLQGYDLDEVIVARVYSTKKYLPFNDDFETDPLGELLSILSGVDAVFQVTFKPSNPKIRKSMLKYADYLQKPKCVGWLNPRIVESDAFSKDLAKKLAEKTTKILYDVDICVCVAGSKGAHVLSHIQSFLDLFSKPPQAFFLWIPRGWRAQKTKYKVLKGMIERRCYGYSVMSAEELKWLVHVVGEEVRADLDWTVEKKEAYLPSDL